MHKEILFMMTSIFRMRLCWRKAWRWGRYRRIILAWCGMRIILAWCEMLRIVLIWFGCMWIVGRIRALCNSCLFALFSSAGCGRSPLTFLTRLLDDEITSTCSSFVKESSSSVAGGRQAVPSINLSFFN